MDFDFTVRWYQQPFYLALVGQEQKRLIEIAHRRWGKDEIVLQAFRDLSQRRVGTYWHCFPEYAQARKAIWNGVNSHTGKRRIDEAYPPQIRKRLNDNDMFIETVWGSTWQLLGSDRYDATVGSGPVGIAYSEWALCNPAAWAYHKPMIEETDGTAAFITTPRGANHAKRMFDRAVKSPHWFAEISSIHDTKTLSSEQLEESLSEYIDLYGEEFGTSLFEQEYLCSFEAAIVGSYYGGELSKARNEGRICPIEWDDSLPVMTVWDLGRTDDTVILFVQIVAGEVRIIDTYDANGRDLEHYASIINGKPYSYNKHWFPHDAQAKTLPAAGRSVYEQMTKDHGLKNVSILRNINTEQQGIIAARRLFPRLWIDSEQDKFIDALTNFRHEWDDENKCFRDHPVKDWTNHYCFTGETEVLTRNGTCRIMDLPATGEVLTLCGWKQYQNPRVTRKNAQLVEVAFTDGLSVRCTPDHSFATANGWRYAKDLAPNTLILSGLTRSHSILTGGCIVYLRAKSIFHAAVKNCIAKFGRPLLASSPTNAMFTTATEMQETTRLETLSAWMGASTSRLSERVKHLRGTNTFATLLGNALPNGTGLKRVGSGIRETLSGRKHGLSGSVLKKTALFAAQNLMRLSAKVATLGSSAGLTAAPQIRVESVRALDITDDVWCLSVPAVGNFALSNGAIVHNCDALRYLAWVWKNPPEPKEVRLNPQIVIGGQSTITMNNLLDVVKKRNVRWD